MGDWCHEDWSACDTKLRLRHNFLPALPGFTTVMSLRPGVGFLLATPLDGVQVLFNTSLRQTPTSTLLQALDPDIPNHRHPCDIAE